MISLRIFFFASITMLVAVGTLHAQKAEAPLGWFAAGMAPKDYQMGVENSVVHSGTAAGHIKAIATPRNFGTYMQTFKATKYRGKRVTLTGYVKSQEVSKWAGMWMRADEGKKSVAFDNMHDRPIKGTTDWAPYSITLEIPKTATSISLGVMLDGPGEVFFDDMNLTIVGKVPRKHAMTEPVDLNFEPAD